MSNILPKDARLTIRSMYRARFIIAGSFVALFVAGLCALALLPSYLAIHAADIGNVPANGSAKTASDADRASLSATRTMLESLSPILTATTTPSVVITKILSLRPSTIRIDHLTYSGGDQGAVVVTGSAATREAINGYRQALSSDAFFKTVSVPVGDLTGAPGARFSLTLTNGF